MPRGHEEILVVEDEPRVRAAMVEQLQSLGYAVSHAADGSAGIAAFERGEAPYDLLLTDVVMPGINGKKLADEVTSRWPRTLGAVRVRFQLRTTSFMRPPRSRRHSCSRNPSAKGDLDHWPCVTRSTAAAV